MDNNTVTLKKQVGQRLASARKAIKIDGKEMTQAQAAEKLNIPKYQTLSSYETGKNFPPIEKIIEMSKLYAVSVNWILFGDSNTSYNSDKEKFKQLVEIVDYFGFSIGFDESSSTDGKYFIILEPEAIYSNSYEYYKMLSTWYECRKLKNNKTIKEHYYNLIIKEAYDSLPDNVFGDDMLF